MATWQAGKATKKSFTSTLPKQNVSGLFFPLKTTLKILRAIIEVVKKCLGKTHIFFFQVGSNILIKAEFMRLLSQ